MTDARSTPRSRAIKAISEELGISRGHIQNALTGRVSAKQSTINRIVEAGIRHGYTFTPPPPREAKPQGRKPGTKVRVRRRVHQSTAGTSKADEYQMGLAAEVNRACDAWLKRRGIVVKQWREQPSPGVQDSDTAKCPDI